MRVIVPLAGPDFIRADGSLKALVKIEGQPLLRHVLSTRSWARAVAPEDHSFVLIDRPETRDFARTTLQDWYPGAQTVFLSDFTRGAALSALAGVAGLKQPDAPVIVDLADILYESTLDPAQAFAAHPRCGGIALTFQSDNPVYSYLRLDGQGAFVEAAEKRVISSNASAGTYLFATPSVYLRALAHALETPDSQTHRDLFFVCPLFNGVRDQGLEVHLHPVDTVTDIKLGG